jgi:hypothetical protein
MSQSGQYFEPVTDLVVDVLSCTVKEPVQLLFSFFKEKYGPTPNWYLALESRFWLIEI